MFQIESRAQMAFLPRMHPTCFYDIVVQVAHHSARPHRRQNGPSVSKAPSGREAPDSLHPSLEPVLARTLGVPLFQEQLLRMAMIAAGFTGGQAEELRRAFGFKRSEARMKEIEKSFAPEWNKTESRRKLRTKSSSRSFRLPYTDSPNPTPPASLSRLRQRLFEMPLSCPPSPPPF